MSGSGVVRSTGRLVFAWFGSYVEAEQNLYHAKLSCICQNSIGWEFQDFTIIRLDGCGDV